MIEQWDDETFRNNGNCIFFPRPNSISVVAYRPVPRVQGIIWALPSDHEDLAAFALMRAAVSRMHARQGVAQGRAGGVLRGSSGHTLRSIRESVRGFFRVRAAAAHRRPGDGLGRRAAVLAWLGIIVGVLLRVAVLVVSGRRCRCCCRVAILGGVEGPQSSPILVPLHLRLYCAQQVSRLPEGLHCCLPGTSPGSSDPEIQEDFCRTGVELGLLLIKCDPTSTTEVAWANLLFRGDGPVFSNSGLGAVSKKASKDGVDGDRSPDFFYDTDLS